MSEGGSISKGLAWKLLERFGVQGVQFILQIVLARLLAPEFYGVLSLMLIFTALADVFIQKGFNTALIQNKDVTDEDYSSVLWISLGISGILYAIIYFTAPIIGAFYEMPDLVWPLRILSLVLFPGALNSVQLAKISRELNFKKVFISNIVGMVVSGIVGIVLAYKGAGLWALVAQSLTNVFVSCIVMRFTVSLKLRFRCNLVRVKILFGFGWKLLVSSLIETLYNDLYTLTIGKKYSSDTLGYYSKGKQFPNFIIGSVNGAVQSVMLPVLSAKQDEKQQAKTIMRTSMMMSSYIIFPMMAGLAAVATPLITILLTDKWLPCVPYMQIYCFSMALYPIHSCNLQAINAMGRSDVFLKLEIIKKVYGMALLIFALVFFESPIAIVAMGIVSTVISSFVNASPNKKLIGYSYFEQMRDILPSLILSLIMFVSVLLLGQILTLAPILELLIQLVVGVLIYLVLSAVFRLKALLLAWNMIKNVRRKKHEGRQ